MPGILLMAAQIGRTRKNRAEAARRMGALHDAVTRRGYAMLYLASDTDGAAVEDVERERRGIVLRIRAPRERDAYVAHMLALLTAIGAPGDVRE